VRAEILPRLLDERLPGSDQGVRCESQFKRAPWHDDQRLERGGLAPIREVAGEIRCLLLLTGLRSPHLPGEGAESILNPDPGRPILDTALQTGFVLLGEVDR